MQSDYDKPAEPSKAKPYEAKPVFMPDTSRRLSFGEKAAGVSFNPSALPEVDRIKKCFAEIIDDLNDQRQKAESPDAKRYFSTAITHAEIAQMLAVKAQTWRH